MEWISVEDRLPGTYEQVVIIGRDPAGYWYRKVLALDDVGWMGQPEVTPTHWMPLPEPPVKEGVDG